MPRIARTTVSSASSLLLVLTACNAVPVVGLPADASTDAVVDAPAQDTGSDGSFPACAEAHASNLEGAHIEIAAKQCRFTLADAAAGIAFQYRIVIDREIQGVVPAPLDAGRCNEPDASGLSPAGRISGGDQLYCLCDVGLCPYRPPPPATLHAGEYPQTYHFSGRNWTGPSDTNSPMGSPFPPGFYDFSVRAKGEVVADGGTSSFEMSAELGFDLVP